MLNTAATKIYWKHDTKNSAEFSKLLASSLPSSAFGSVGTGAAYLAFTRHTQHVCSQIWRPSNSPILRPHPEERPELNRGRYDDLSDKTSQHFLRHQTGSRSLRVDARERQSSAHCFLISRSNVQKEAVNVLVTAIGMMMKRSMYKNYDLH